MAMLAETTGGNSRQQILDLFGVDTIEQLRQQAGNVWNAHYSDDGETTLLLANSLWLDDAYAFKKQTAQLLADRYYASSFRGDLGTEELDKQLQAWLNENTDGLLKDQTQKVTLDPQTVFALASTVYFSAGWDAKFSEGNTKDAVFHAPNGDLTTPFMNKTITQYTYYWGDNFGAIYLELTGDNRMWLILPDEGYTTTDILASEDYLHMTLNPGSWKDQKTYKINLSLPKFDISTDTSLIDGMKAMGLSDIFIPGTANFSPMTEDSKLLAPHIGKIDHAVRVAIDEEGVVAAAFTVIEMKDNDAPMLPENEIDFVLDRPFLFLVTDDVPLFAGVVEQP
jgi:serine protease inhibitor